MSGERGQGVRADARVVVVGEALVDIVHRADGTVDEAPGGSPANVALTLGRLGRAPRLVTGLADDAHGRALRAWLERSGVAVDAVDARRTATATAHLDASGAATYEFDIEWALGAASIADVDVLHVGSVAALLEPGARDVSRLVDEVRGGAIITYDPNIRPSLLADADAARVLVDALVRRADVVKASDEDLRWLHPDAEPADVAARWQRSGPAIVVVTLGADGAFAVTANGVVRVPGVDDRGDRHRRGGRHLHGGSHRLPDRCRVRRRRPARRAARHPSSRSGRDPPRVCGGGGDHRVASRRRPADACRARLPPPSRPVPAASAKG